MSDETNVKLKQLDKSEHFGRDVGTEIVEYVAPKPRGFAALSPEQRKLIAAAGGRAVPAHKRAFSQDAELASKAGHAGGLNGHGGGRPKKVPEND